MSFVDAQPGFCCGRRTGRRVAPAARRLSAAIVMLASAGLPAIAQAADVDAELEWANRVTLSVPVTGRIEQVLVRPGDTVAAAAPLLRLDAREAQARVAQAKAQLQKLDLQRAEAEREWERARELFDRTVLSERELQLAEIGLNNADAEYQAALTEQVAATVALEQHSLAAPFAARVLAVPVAPGQAVVNNSAVTPLIDIAAQELLRARAQLDAAQAAALEIDAEVAVRIGSERFTARVVQLGFEPLDAQRPARYGVAAEFSVPADTPLRAGQAAILELP